MRGPTGACCSRKAARSRAIPTSRAGSSIRSTAPPTSSTACRISPSRSRSRSSKPGGSREITHGLVYQPLTDESFWAEKGRGAWLQDRRLRVSARRDLDEALIGTGIPHLRPRRRRRAGRKIYGAIAPEVCRRPPLRLGRARPRLGRGGPVRRLLGRRSRHLGHRRGRAAGQGSGRLRHRLSRVRTACSSAANISPPTASCTASCTSCSPGRSARRIWHDSRPLQALRRYPLRPKAPPSFRPVEFSLGQRRRRISADPAVPRRRAGAVGGVRRAADAGQPPDRRAQARRREAQRI